MKIGFVDRCLYPIVRTFSFATIANRRIDHASIFCGLSIAISFHFCFELSHAVHRYEAILFAFRMQNWVNNSLNIFAHFVRITSIRECVTYVAPLVFLPFVRFREYGCKVIYRRRISSTEDLIWWPFFHGCEETYLCFFSSSSSHSSRSLRKRDNSAVSPCFVGIASSSVSIYRLVGFMPS